MKRLIFTTTTIFLFLIISCTNKLELVPISTKSVDGFYKTESQFYQGIMGCYDGLQVQFVTSGFSYQLTESRSDNAWQNIDYDDGHTSRFTVNSELGVLNSAWVTSYNNIARCNYILKYLNENTELSVELMNQYKGEALFIRSLIYFDLVRFFGEVPIVDKILTIDESYSIGKSSIEKVYDFIVNDLSQASQLLPTVKPSEKKNRATAIAARAFLGKVYIYRSGYPLNKDEWGLAVTELKAVLDGIGPSGFFTNYADIFNYSNEGKDQSIFSIGFKSGAEGEGNPYPTRNAPNGINPGDDPLMIPYGGSPSQLFLDDYILESLFDEPGDLRFDHSVQTKWIEKSQDTITNWPFVKKYTSGPIARNFDWDIDWILLRYTDVYMLYGEALYHSGSQFEALNIINKVRNRAGLVDLNMSDIDTETKFIDLILKERRKEFCFENQRWFDLVRTDRAYEVMKSFLAHYRADANLKSKDQYFYPIPLRETNITGLK